MENFENFENFEKVEKSLWLVGVANEQRDYVILQQFIGTVEAMKDCLVSLINEDKNNDKENYCSAPQKTEDIREYLDVDDPTRVYQLEANATYKNYRITYTAVLAAEKEPIEL